jgi:hypothetical protein
MQEASVDRSGTIALIVHDGARGGHRKTDSPRRTRRGRPNRGVKMGGRCEDGRRELREWCIWLHFVASGGSGAGGGGAKKRWGSAGAVRSRERKSCSKSILFVATRRGSTGDMEVSLRDAVGGFRSLKRAPRRACSCGVFGWERARLYIDGRRCASAMKIRGRTRLVRWNRGFFRGGGGCAGRVAGAHRIARRPCRGRELRRKHSIRFRRRGRAGRRAGGEGG